MNEKEYTKLVKENKDIIERLARLGVLKSDINACRKYNIGASNYSNKLIQPWAIWQEYELNPWDADILKRTLREKKENGITEIESRIQDYLKIQHICDERIRQLRYESENKNTD